MTRCALLLLLCFALLGADAPERPIVSADGFAGVRIGMSVDEASRAYGGSLEPASPVHESDRGCYYVYPAGAIGPVSFMISKERVARIDIDARGPKTAAGVGVGSTEAEVREAYAGAVETSPHKYVDGHYLMVRGPEDRALLFETENGRVTGFRAGQLPQVRWVEGCS